MAGVGEILALITAVTWALAVVFFRRSGEKVHPVALNLFKNVLAVMLFVPTAWLLSEPLLHDAPAADYIYMLVGGVVGISIADTMFFVSLNYLGAGLSAIVSCMYSPFIILCSILILGETLTLLQGFGVLLIVGAVLAPVFEKAGTGVEKRALFLGILWGLLSLAAMAASIVPLKPMLDRSPLVWASTLRMVGGALGLAVYLAFTSQRGAILATLKAGNFRFTLWGSLLGGYLGMLLWLGGMKYTLASIAGALNQTSNIFLFIFGAMLLKEPVTKERMVGILLGVVGALLVIIG